MFTVKIDHMNLHQIANSGQCFRWQQINDNTYKIPAFGRELTISQDGDLFTLSCDENEWNSIWKNYFDVDTDTDYDEVEEIIKYIDDDYLKDAYEFGSGIRILRQDLWEVIVSFIISQNNNIPRIKKSVKKLCNELDGDFPDCFDIFNMNTCHSLSNMGLGYRDKYLLNASSGWIINGGYSYLESETYEEAKERLMKIKGVGDKVSDCTCLFGLHHLEAFPVDTHIRKILDREYDGEMPTWVDSKYAGLFQQYLFYYDINHPPIK